MMMMQAAVYSSFSSNIEVKSIPKPILSSTDKDAVIIQVMATGVCRSDWHGWKGHDDDIKKHGLPFIPGHEFSGIIVEKGSLAHQSLQIGDRVAVPFILSCGSCCECKIGKPTVCMKQEQPGFTFYGSFAEFVKINRASRNIRLLPEGVSFVEAAALGCRFTTAYRAVLQQGLGIQQLMLPNHQDNGHVVCHPSFSSSDWAKREKSIAIFGCGGLGLSCVMIAKAFQSEGKINKIIAVDVSSKALEKAIELGATHYINASHFHGSNEKIIQKVLDMSDGLGVEISIDAAGFQSTCENALYCTRRGCRMIQVGLPIASKRPNINMGFVAGREIEILGSHGFDACYLPLLLNLISEGRLDVKKLIEKETSLEEGVVTLMNMDKTSPLGMVMITKFSTQLTSCKL